MSRLTDYIITVVVKDDRGNDAHTPIEFPRSGLPGLDRVRLKGAVFAAMENLMTSPAGYRWLEKVMDISSENKPPEQKTSR